MASKNVQCCGQTGTDFTGNHSIWIYLVCKYSSAHSANAYLLCKRNTAPSQHSFLYHDRTVKESL